MQGDKFELGGKESNAKETFLTPEAFLVHKIRFEEVLNFEDQDRGFSATLESVLEGVEAEVDTELGKVLSAPTLDRNSEVKTNETELKREDGNILRVIQKWTRDKGKQKPTFFQHRSRPEHIPPFHKEFLEYYCPVLADICYNAGENPVTPTVLLDVDLDVFGLLQNDAINMLERRRGMEQSIQTKPLQYIYERTEKGDKLRAYLVYICSRPMCDFSDEVRGTFPQQMMEKIEEVTLVKLEDMGKEGLELEWEIDTSKYHVDDE
ncbi:hypothetical protein G7Y89_g4761 [Cudoniella acicularis]|uniref:Uncharacterized protein n=1 Tax=Cudoniella acicularis TaxID=354080 RepID=A0A8H4RQZ8_9HELO|nr:hypothetical protein G7Y89_g4761 [Cudoniella acicularis]